jgi:hypothetical protein
MERRLAYRKAAVRIYKDECRLMCIELCRKLDINLDSVGWEFPEFAKMHPEKEFRVCWDLLGHVSGNFTGVNYTSENFSDAHKLRLVILAFCEVI